MSKLAYLHQTEIITFRSTEPRRLEDALPLFLTNGFELHEDIVRFARAGNVPPWQSSSIAGVTFQYDGEEVFGFDDFDDDEGDWNTVQIYYLLASLPFELASSFVEIIDKIEKDLRIPPEYQGAVTSSESLLKEFQKHRDELVYETNYEPGSESLAILIQQLLRTSSWREV